jgi:hypothetical protein
MMNPADYPSDWKPISHAIRTERAQGRCECDGRCGIDHAAEAASTDYLREIAHVVAEFYPQEKNPARCLAMNRAPHPVTESRVVLTVAHLCERGCVDAPAGKAKCGNRAHLLAMCQRCHLRLDQIEHQRNARRTRRARLHNLDLFPV